MEKQGGRKVHISYLMGASTDLFMNGVIGNFRKVSTLNISSNTIQCSSQKSLGGSVNHLCSDWSGVWGPSEKRQFWIFYLHHHQCRIQNHKQHIYIHFLVIFLRMHRILVQLSLFNDNLGFSSFKVNITNLYFLPNFKSLNAVKDSSATVTLKKERKTQLVSI